MNRFVSGETEEYNGCVGQQPVGDKMVEIRIAQKKKRDFFEQMSNCQIYNRIVKLNSNNFL